MTQEVACVTCDHRERTEKFLPELLAIIGHDLQGPLAAILLSAELLTMASGEPSVAAVHRITSFANRMTRMFDQLLDLTRVRIGDGIPLVARRTRLGALVSDLVAEAAATYPQSHFELVAIDDDVHGLWDPDRLAQVVSNILGNAVQHGRRDGRVSVTVALAEGGATIEISNDILQPISHATLATLFAPYRRSWDPEHAGIGLGLDLYLAQEIIHAHGGSITAESSDSGTTFRIVLPTTPTRPA